MHSYTNTHSYQLLLHLSWHIDLIVFIILTFLIEVQNESNLLCLSTRFSPIHLFSNLIISIYLGCSASGGVGKNDLYPDIFRHESDYK